jgi:leucine dehydrogenase
MSVFEAPDYDDHEQVLFVNEPEAGLRAIIAVHNTRLGPGLGGCRMWPYASEAEAVRDVLRLSRGMTYKSAILDCGLGGGKSVIIGDSRTQKSAQMFHAMGRWINTLGERYIVGEDIGTNPLDMKEMRKETRCVSCLRKEDGGYGDPASLTALGVFSAIRAGAQHMFGADDISDARVAVQGVGNVGQHLIRLLCEAGAKVVACDVNNDNLQSVVDELSIETVGVDDIYDQAMDIYAPCAMGAVLNDQTIPRLGARIIAGAANNQLDEDRHGLALAERGITYLPDYVANGGGLISCAAEWYRHDIEEIPEKVRGIYDTSLAVLRRAERDSVTPNMAADQLAEERFKPAND